MYAKVFIGILLILFLSGCATTKNNHEIQAQEFQRQVDYLQSEIRKRDHQIENLESEIERLQYERLYPSQQNQKTKGHVVADVKKTAQNIQIALKKGGFYKGPVDGKMGPETKAAIKAFQKANGFKPDGEVGKRTWNGLRKFL